MSTTNHYKAILDKVHEKADQFGRSPDEITVVAVSKNAALEKMALVYEEGCRDFGESRLQEAEKKLECLPDDCRWHYIGTLQSKKISKVLNCFHLIHSVDTPELAKKISEASQARGIVTPILLQVNTSGEMSKHGLSPEAWERDLESVNQFKFIEIRGLMTMAPFTEDEKVIRLCFKKLRELREKWRSQMQNSSDFSQLSMGMSHDYEIAIEEGATLLRIGTAIFS